MLEGFNTSGSIIAEHIDEALTINLWLSVVLFISVVAPMLYLAWKYREDKVKDEDVENITHNTTLEILWTTIPTAMMFLFFWYGYTSMVTARTLPDANNAITIKVEGSKWKWRFEYPANEDGFVHKLGGAYTKPIMDENGKIAQNGTMGISAIYVPADTNIILEMTAPTDDVLHSFYIPALRMKEDVVPGRVTKQWFNVKNPSEYDISVLSTVVRITHICILDLLCFQKMNIILGLMLVRIHQKVIMRNQVLHYYSNMDVKLVMQL